jgi:hypothetical protein
MKKTYESISMFVRWAIAGMLSLIAVLPTLTSISAAI